jgi:hypothetical protein
MSSGLEQTAMLVVIVLTFPLTYLLLSLADRISEGGNRR